MLNFTKKMPYSSKNKTNENSIKNRAVKLYKNFNHDVFRSKLPSKPPITWSTRMVSTAGKCCFKRNGKSFEFELRLSTKVLNCEKRLFQTLFHEMCHAAVRVINNETVDDKGQKYIPKNRGQSNTQL